MTIIPTEILARALHFVSNEETRYYLKGVFVTSSGRHVTVAATDGTILYAWGMEQEGATFTAIIPADALKAALKAHKRATTLPIRMDGDLVILDSTPCRPIDGTYPDIARVIPSQTTGEAIEGLDPKLLARIAKALGIACPAVYLNGNAPCVVHTENAHEMVIVMPRRNVDRIAEPKDWREHLGNVFGRSQARAAA